MTQNNGERDAAGKKLRKSIAVEPGAVDLNPTQLLPSRGQLLAADSQQRIRIGNLPKRLGRVRDRDEVCIGWVFGF